MQFWAEALLPAIDAARRGAGAFAWSNLALLAGLAMLPLTFELAGDLPAPSWPGPQLLGVVAALGLSCYIGVCVHAGLNERDA